MKFLTLKDMDLENKKVLVRVDFNVPIKNGMVADDTRLRASIPTINFLLEKHCQIILMSHLGRPQELLKQGKKLDEIKKKLTLKPVAEDLSDILGIEVGFVQDCIDIEIPDNKDIVLLGQKKSEKSLAKIKELNKEYFYRNQENYVDIKDKLLKKRVDIKNNKAKNYLDNMGKDLDKLKANIDNMENKISMLNDELEKIDIKKLKEDMQKKINKKLNVNINLL